MNNLKTIGRILFAFPFAVFGLMHLMKANVMAGIVPSFVPGGVIWVYVTGLVLIGGTISIITQKQIYVAALVLAGLMLIFVLTIHLPGLLGGNQMAMSGDNESSG